MHKFKVFYESFAVEVSRDSSHGAFINWSRNGRSQCCRIIEVDDLDNPYKELLQGLEEDGYSNMINHYFKLNDDGSIDKEYEEQRVVKFYEQHPKLKEALSKLNPIK